MRISSGRLLGLPVVTESGFSLGKVISFEIDISTQAIVRYAVGRRRWPAKIDFLISPSEVLGITSERMTVRDAAVKASEEETLPRDAMTRISPVVSYERPQS